MLTMSCQEFFLLGCKLTSMDSYLLVISARAEAAHDQRVSQLRNRIEVLSDNIISGHANNIMLLNDMALEILREVQELQRLYHT
jgi:hypothetical protein